MSKKSEAAELSMLTAGEPGCAAALQGGRLVWRCHLQGGQWRKSVELPPGVEAADVASIFPSRAGCTVLTRGGDVHVWTLAGGAGLWDRRGNVHEAAR